MALPELFLPVTLPDFKAGAHKVTPGKLYAPVDRQGGTSRRRRLFTSVPRLLETQLEVTQAQLEDFVAWHETALQAGAAPFTAKVAKMGAGVEYWEAYCLGFTAEHAEGSIHTLTLTLRLKGSPSDTLPVAASLSSEFSAALSVGISGGYEWGLAAEVSVGLAFEVATGAALSAEFAAILAVACSGVVSDPSLDAEIIGALEAYFVVEPSAALAGEIVAGLSFAIAEDNPLAVEFSAPLSFEVAVGSSAGYRNPATVVVSDAGAPFKGSVTATVRIKPDGTVYTRESSAAYVQVDAFYLPLTPGVANGKYVRAVLTFGSGSDIAPVPGPVYQFNATDPLSWVVSASWLDSPIVNEVHITIQIANDPDILDIISSFSAELSAEYF